MKSRRKKKWASFTHSCAFPKKQIIIVNPNKGNWLNVFNCFLVICITINNNILCNTKMHAPFLACWPVQPYSIAPLHTPNTHYLITYNYHTVIPTTIFTVMPSIRTHRENDSTQGNIHSFRMRKKNFSAFRF